MRRVLRHASGRHPRRGAVTDDVNTATSPLGFSRVVVAIGAAMPGRAALEAGVDLAAALNAALEGLFVENAELWRVSALPGARETSALTGTRRPLAAGALDRAFRIEAARIERQLAAEAARMRVACSFAVERGELWAIALARDAELIVLEGPVPPRPPAMSARTRGPLMTVFDASPASRRGLAAAARLANRNEREVVVLVPAADRGDARSLRTEAESALAANRATGVALPTRLERGDVMATARSRRCALLVLPGPLVALWSPDIASIAGGAPCPLVIAR